MHKFKFFAIALLGSVVFLSSCGNDDDPVLPNEEELITTVKYTLTPVGGGTPIVFTYQDLDGEGGNAPVITGGDLAASTNYTAAIELLNETKNPAENITEEIEEEAAEHQFFFRSTAGLTFTYDDTDPNGRPVGLRSKLATGGARTGTFTVILRHEPNKSASGVSSGDITNAGGETDIEVTFNVNVK